MHVNTQATDTVLLIILFR